MSRVTHTQQLKYTKLMFTLYISLQNKENYEPRAFQRQVRSYSSKHI